MSFAVEYFPVHLRLYLKTSRGTHHDVGFVGDDALCDSAPIGPVMGEPVVISFDDLCQVAMAMKPE
jgi:hypothetical protein